MHFAGGFWAKYGYSGIIDRTSMIKVIEVSRILVMDSIQGTPLKRFVDYRRDVTQAHRNHASAMKEVGSFVTETVGDAYAPGTAVLIGESPEGLVVINIF